MTEYRVAEITETAEELDAKLEHKEYYAEKIAGLKPESRRLREILAVRCLLKEMTGEEQAVVYDEEGKPGLIHNSQCIMHSDVGANNICPPQQHLSISHTDGYAAVILGDKPVGIDIERHGRKVEKVVSRFMQDSEIALANNYALCIKHYELILHLVWSAKEAAYKVLGKEYFDLQNLTCVKDIDFEKEIITMDVIGREEPLTIHFKYTDAYVLCYLEL